MNEGFLGTLFAPLLEQIRAHIAWAGPVVLLLSFVESLAIISAFVPATLLLLAIGSLAAAGLIGLFELCLWAVAGGGLGYWLSYEVGRRYANQIESIGFFARRPDWVSRGHQFFERWGSLAVAVSRFIPLARAVVPLFAGVMGSPRKAFQSASWISALIWAPLMLAPASIGTEIGTWLQDASPQFRAIVMIALVVAVVLLVRKFRR